MSHVFARDTHGAYPMAVAARGLYITDAEGKHYLDASGGAAVSCLGHGHPAVRAAMIRQLDRLDYAHTGTFTNEAQEALADELIAHAPAGMSRVLFVTSGSEATESALKLARQYHVEHGRAQRRHFISRRFSYHGNTLGALAVSGHRSRRATYLPLLQDVTQIEPCFAYRHRRPAESEAEYAARTADELEAAILRQGPDSVAAFIAETVVGATLGAVAAVTGYFERVRRICDRYGVLLILDEVLCGMGRTGTLYASEQEHITADLMILGKGLGAGYQPIAAVLATASVYDAIAGGSGSFNNGHTYMGHAVGCAAALAVQRVIRQENLLEDVRARGQRLDDLLAERLADHPHVGDIRGRGLLRAVELVEDRTTKRPFAAEKKLQARIKQHAMARGLLCYPGAGAADGVRGDHVLLAPPFTVTDEACTLIVERLASAIDSALESIGP